MFKLVFPCQRANFLRYFVVRLTPTKKCQNSINENPLVTRNLKFYSSYNNNNNKNNINNNSNDSRVNNFYEYPDVNFHEDDTDTPYTSWEGAENRHAHSIMEKNKDYDKTIAFIPVCKDQAMISEKEAKVILEKNYRTESVTTTINNFRLISHYAKNNGEIIYDPKYRNIINSISKNAKILTDNEICHVLQSLMLWFVESNEDGSSYSILCNALDAECKSRSYAWQKNKILYVSDHWYRLRLVRRSKFMIHAVVRLGQNPGNLSPRNIVQLMFYASVSKNGLINFRDIEAQLKNNIKHLDINEIAIIALGFFKSQTMIRDRTLLNKIINRTIEEIDSINEISFAAILKVVRYSIHINDLDFLCKLLENTIPQIPRLSVTCLVHVILAAANRSLFYAELLNAVAARFYREISKVRMKDIRCLIFALSSFNYVPEKQPNIFDRVIRELNESKRQKELRQFPKCFATCLHHLSILNIHPKNLIAQALDPEMIQKAYGSDVNTIRREILALDLDIEAEIPDYRGPRLDTRTRENVAMRLTDWAPRPKTSQLSATDHFMIDVIRICEDYCGSKDMVHVDHVLPQYQRADIIICLDKTNSPIPMSSTLSKLPFGNVKHPPKISIGEDIRWLALIIGSNNSYAKNTKRLLGHMCAKHRQLEYIGYTPFVIYWQDWSQLKNDVEKFKYLQYKVFF